MKEAWASFCSDIFAGAAALGIAFLVVIIISIALGACIDRNLDI